MPQADAVESSDMPDIAQAILSVVTFDEQRQRKVVLLHHRNRHTQKPPSTVLRGLFRLIGGKGSSP